MTAAPRIVPVPSERVVRWFSNFGVRHGEPAYEVVDGRLRAWAPDGADVVAALPFDGRYAGAPDPAAFAAAVMVPARWGLLLVRKGGFAVATVAGGDLLDVKVGRRHVQGRTKAGGQSQQRFARRRDNQARQAYQAAADHAASVLSGPVEALVCGGDRPAVEAVLSDPRLQRLADVRVGPWLAVPDPRRDVVERAVAEAAAVSVRVAEPAG